MEKESSFYIRRFGDRDRITTKVGESSQVQQNLLAETDINAIMAKYQKTGLITHVNKYAGEYGDFSGIPDFKTGLERVHAAEDMFMSLPAKIRDRFHNDPGEFIAFATNPSNLEEMQKIGLAPEKAASAAERPTLVAKEAADPPKEAPKPKSDPKGDQ